MSMLTLVGMFTGAPTEAQINLSEVVRDQAGQLGALRTELAEVQDLVVGGSDDADDEFGAIDIHGFVSQGFMKSSDNNYLTDDSQDDWFLLLAKATFSF